MSGITTPHCLSVLTQTLPCTQTCIKTIHLVSSPLGSGDEIEPPQSYRDSMNRRRKSVFAESYEPGEENAAVEKVINLLYHISDQLLMFSCGLPYHDMLVW